MLKEITHTFFQNFKKMSRGTRNNTAIKSVTDIRMPETQQDQESSSTNSGMITRILNLAHQDTTNTTDRPLNLATTRHQVSPHLVSETSDSMQADTLPLSYNLHSMTHYTTRNAAQNRNRPGAFNTLVGSFNILPGSFNPSSRSAREQATGTNHMPPPTLPESRYLQGHTAILLSMRNARRPRQDTDQQNQRVMSELESEEDSHVTITSGSECFQEL